MFGNACRPIVLESSSCSCSLLSYGNDSRHDPRGVFGFVQWTSAFLGASSNRGTNIENCTLLRDGHFRPDPPMVLSQCTVRKISVFLQKKSVKHRRMYFYRTFCINRTVCRYTLLYVNFTDFPCNSTGKSYMSVDLQGNVYRHICRSTENG
jgi:hypothetical protein